MPILVRVKPNLQWLKFTMVTTEMVSSADNTARGFLPMTGGGLAAGLDAFSSKVLKPKYESVPTPSLVAKYKVGVELNI